MNSSQKSAAVEMSSWLSCCSPDKSASARLLRQSRSRGRSSVTRKSSGCVFSQLGVKPPTLDDLRVDSIDTSSARLVAVTTMRWSCAARPVMHRSTRGNKDPASSRPSKSSNNLWHCRFWRNTAYRRVSSPKTMAKYQQIKPSPSSSCDALNRPSCFDASPLSLCWSSPPSFCSRAQRSITGMRTGSRTVESVRQCITSLHRRQDFPEPGWPTTSHPGENMSSETSAWMSDQKKICRPASSTRRGTGP
mmetsp:Transcript_28334/g.74736  ORF Transcript_28334/g.74736 Transcript_28334/m.74736 type:complete len:248 (-) Transcript_28334:1829-2572(-)